MAGDQLFLGIDVGTHETKGVLTTVTGRIVATAARAHGLSVPRPGWAEQDADRDWWEDVADVSRRLMGAAAAEGGTVAAAAVSAIGPCCLPIDDDLTPLHPAILYGIDCRASEQVDALTAELTEDAIVARCGAALSSQSVGPKIAWLRAHRPKVFSAARWFVSATTYIVAKLTGHVVVDPYTAAGFAPLFDITSQQYVDVPSVVECERLAQVRPTAAIVGTVTAAAAAATLLPVGLPVTTGTIDAAAEAASVGVGASGDAMVMFGSTVFAIATAPAAVGDSTVWSAPWLFGGTSADGGRQVRSPADDRRPTSDDDDLSPGSPIVSPSDGIEQLPLREGADRSARCDLYAGGGQYAVMGGLATSGIVTQWFAKTFARELDESHAFTVLTAEAAAAPAGSRGLLCLPHFSGERTPLYDGDARGVFFGLDLKHTRGEMFRSVLEGIASSTARMLRAFRAAGARPRRWVAVGGGCKNAVWVQATADAVGESLYTCQQSVGASLGDAFLAAVACGAAIPTDISKWNPIESEHKPSADPAMRRMIAAHQEIFESLYEATKDAGHRLARLHSGSDAEADAK